MRESTTIAGVPALLFFRESASKAASRGIILFFHGLGASKETGDKELTALAGLGFLAVGLDNAGHGSRRRDDFDEYFSPVNPRFEKDFSDAVLETAFEVPDIIDELTERYGAATGPVGAAGISMGGFITYAALTVEKRITVACPILGSPRLAEGEPRSPHLHPDSFFPCALLAQNAGADKSVPPVDAREFTSILAPFYSEAPGRLEYLEFEGADHFMPEADWNELWANVLDWFRRFLR